MAVEYRKALEIQMFGMDIPEKLGYLKDKYDMLEDGIERDKRCYEKIRARRNQARDRKEFNDILKFQIEFGVQITEDVRRKYKVAELYDEVLNELDSAILEL